VKLFIDTAGIISSAFGLLAMTLLLIFPVSAMALSPSDTSLSAPKEPIVVNGDSVEYFHEKKMVVGVGNISIKFKDVDLTCDKITVYLDTREAIAEGHVKVTQKGAYLTGEKMNYNFDSRKGTIIKGYLNAKPFYGKADDIDKKEYKDEFRMKNGYVTTCDLEVPHYRVQARQVEVYLRDKVVARHIIVYVKNTPILYWPYYVQPLKDKKSHIIVMPGQRKDWGYYALTAYRYYLDDKNRGDILLDYRTKWGLAEGVNHYYYSKDLGEGAVKFYYSHQNDMLAYAPAGAVQNRYRWQVRHQWDLGYDTDTVATLEFNKLSDVNIIKDYFYNEYEEIGASPDNYLSFLTQKDGYSTELLFRKRFNKFQTVTERLPEFNITIPDNNFIKDVPLFYRSNASAVYLNQTFDNSNTASPQKDKSTARVDAYNRFSYAMKFFRTLSVIPYASLEDTYYSQTAGEPNRIRNIFSAGVDNSIRFYKIYDVESNFAGLDIHKLRHIITPAVNYNYTHTPTITPNKLMQIDAIDAIGESNSFTFGLENRLQTKRSEGDQMKSVDLATLLVGTTYNFILKKDSFDAKYDKFSPIDFKLELVPYDWAYIQSTMSVDPKRYWVQNWSLDLVSSWKDKWSLAMSYRYEHVVTGQSTLITMDGSYQINEKWRARAYERYNTFTAALEEQEYTITRDLHCWLLEFTYNIKSLGDHNVWLVCKLKAFPETPIGLKQTYSRPRFGAVGEH